MSLSERIQWQPPNPNSALENFEERCRVAKAQPFLDEKPMNDTAAACAWENFRRPLLGRFTRHGRIDFIKLLGYGQDGIVWKVGIYSQIYALKVFWDNQPPEGTRYWAFQRECQNASLLAKMRFAIDNSSDPIWLNPNPTTFRDAASNLHAFSNEGCSRQLYRKMLGALEYSAAPRLRECYGWTSISGKELCTMPSVLYPPEVRLGDEVRKISPTDEYCAIVYEYVPSSDVGLDVDVVQAQLDFLWLGGWCLVPLQPANWGGVGILLDMGDPICLWHAGWFKIHDPLRDLDPAWISDHELVHLPELDAGHMQHQPAAVYCSAPVVLLPQDTRLGRNLIVAVLCIRHSAVHNHLFHQVRVRGYDLVPLRESVEDQVGAVNRVPILGSHAVVIFVIGLIVDRVQVLDLERGPLALHDHGPYLNVSKLMSLFSYPFKNSYSFVFAPRELHRVAAQLVYQRREAVEFLLAVEAHVHVHHHNVAHALIGVAAGRPVIRRVLQDLRLHVYVRIQAHVSERDLQLRLDRIPVLPLHLTLVCVADRVVFLRPFTQQCCRVAVHEHRGLVFAQECESKCDQDFSIMCTVLSPFLLLARFWLSSASFSSKNGSIWFQVLILSSFMTICTHGQSGQHVPGYPITLINPSSLRTTCFHLGMSMNLLVHTVVPILVTFADGVITLPPANEMPQMLAVIGILFYLLLWCANTTAQHAIRAPDRVAVINVVRNENIDKWLTQPTSYTPSYESVSMVTSKAVDMLSCMTVDLRSTMDNAAGVSINTAIVTSVLRIQVIEVEVMMNAKISKSVYLNMKVNISGTACWCSVVKKR
ncbi:hypothetical protein FGADI_12643, partial [Fusarium gaditjirri]